MSPAVKILICFILALATVTAVRFLLGEKRDLWFKRSPARSFITLRTPIAMYVALGYPVTREGYLITAALIAIILGEIFLIAYIF